MGAMPALKQKQMKFKNEEAEHPNERLALLSYKTEARPIGKPLSSPGGKYYLNKFLLAGLVECKIYVEPFAGGLSTFFGKKPSAKEVVSDMDKNFIDFYRFLKCGSEEDFKWLRNQKFKPSFSYFNYILKKYKPKSLRESAYRILYIQKTSFGSKGQHFGWGLITDSKSQRVLNKLEILKRRLKDTVILYRDGIETIKKYDSPETFFLLDPPWRDLNIKGFKKNFSNEELASLLPELKGKFLLVIEPEFAKPYLEAGAFDVKRVKSKRVLNQKGKPVKSPYYLISNYQWQMRADLCSQQENSIKSAPKEHEQVALFPKC